MSELEKVLALKHHHRQTWQEKPEWYWMFGLGEEVVELALTLAGLHAGPVEWELQQIASIALNWLEMRESKEKDDDRET